MIISETQSVTRIVSCLSKAGEISARQLSSTLHLGHPTIHSKLRLLVATNRVKMREVSGEQLFSLVEEGRLTEAARRRLALQKNLDFPLPAWMPGKGFGDFLQALS